MVSRHEPKLILMRSPGAGVRMTLGGNALPSSGHTVVSSSTTSYGVRVPGASPCTTTSP
jgi:hypothetical protein